MAIKNTTTSYGIIAKAFHWIMFLILVGMIVVGFYMHGLPSDTPEQMTYKFGLYDLHKSFGLLVLMLVLLRLGWRLINPVPEMSGSLSRIEALSAHGMHMLLYVMMLTQPLSGWAMALSGGHPVKFFGVQLPALLEKNAAMKDLFYEIHEIGAIALIVLFVLHMFAALFHHFVRKDDILTRMLPQSSKTD